MPELTGSDCGSQSTYNVVTRQTSALRRSLSSISFEIPLTMHSYGIFFLRTLMAM